MKSKFYVGANSFALSPGWIVVPIYVLVAIVKKKMPLIYFQFNWTPVFSLGEFS